MNNASSASLESSSRPILLDTHVIIWMATGDPRLRRIDVNALADPSRELLVSAVVAFEFVDLQLRGRIAVTEPWEILQEQMAFRMVDFPASCWREAAALPAIHKDPVDRMLIAHALCDRLVLATADANIRRYPVPVL